MKIYNYNPLTGEFLKNPYTDDGSCEADESPLEQDVYLIPANATTLEPTKAKESQVEVFEDNKWVIKSDFRNKIYYDKTTRQPITITFIGDIPDTLQETLPEKTIAELAQEKLNENDVNFNSAVKAGIIYKDIKYDINVEAKSNIAGKFSALLYQQFSQGLSDEQMPSVNWLDYNWVNQTLTYADFKTLALQVTNKSEKMYNKRGANILALTEVGGSIKLDLTKEQINSVNTDYTGI